MDVAVFAGYQKKQEPHQEKDWCVVLNHLPGEIDKKRVAQKITETFQLSSEEAMELVRSTPVILLDHLTLEIAVKIKDYFRTAGAEIILSNETVYKRKCYRTVWPHAPNLNFLHDWKSQDPSAGEAYRAPLAPDEALFELRTIQKKDESEGVETLSIPSAAGFVHPLEKESWRKAQKPSAQPVFSEKISGMNTPQPAGNSPKEPAFQPAAAEQEIKQLKRLLDQTEKKLENLRKESKDARNLYEEKLLSARQERDALQHKTEEITSHYHQLQKEKQSLHMELQEKEVQTLKLQSEKTTDRASWEKQFIQKQEEIVSLSDKLKDLSRQVEGVEDQRQEWKAQWAEKQIEISRLQSENQKRAEKISQLETDREELLRVRQEQERIFDGLMAQKQEEMRGLQDELQKLAGMVQRFQEEKERWEQQRTQQEEAVSALKERLKKLEEEASRTFSAYEALKGTLAVRALTSFQNTEPAELRTQTDEEPRWAVRLQNSLAQYHQTIEKILTRLIERDAAGIQNERVSGSSDNSSGASAEQIKQILADKESLLRRLVGEQEKMEKEIREREESIRKVIMDQEAVERGIAEAKKIQRQWAASEKNRAKF